MLEAISYIKEQLAQREIPIALQRFKKLVTQAGQNRYEINAYNELLFLTTAPELPLGTKIISDSNIIEIGPEHASSESLEEFSGLVAIVLPNNLTDYPVLEFIQIIL